MKTVLIMLSAVVLGANACTNSNNSNGMFSGNGGSTQFTHYVGELYGGGIVAAVWKVKGVEHGLIASLNDLSNGQVWSNLDTSLIGPTAQSAVNGQANSKAIMSQIGAVSTAASLCDNYVAGDFKDWYLPSTWEMNQLYNSALQINSVLDEDEDATTKGFEFINTPYYWTSTEYFNAKSWLQNFLIGSTYNDFKSAPYRIRAVRRF